MTSLRYLKSIKKYRSKNVFLTNFDILLYDFFKRAPSIFFVPTFNE